VRGRQKEGYFEGTRECALPKGTIRKEKDEGSGKRVAGERKKARTTRGVNMIGKETVNSL